MKSRKEYTLPEDYIDKLIHEPARLKIVLYLYSVETADFVYLMHKTGLSKGNLSSHLSKLEQAGYVDVEKTFVDKIPKTLLTLSDKGSQEFLKYKEILVTLLKSVD